MGRKVALVLVQQTRGRDPAHCEDHVEAAAGMFPHRLALQVIFSLSKSTSFGAGGHLSFMSSNIITTVSATTRSRYHFRFPLTMYQGALPRLAAEIPSSNPPRYSSPTF